ncbi:MAG: site-specific DNA-methyltransferase [Arcobacteraceae bacterium]|jgi:adenine-specific DNA-methyltransferase|nr:site-specific DNA-methyltransferase [Arcobacteraceae bacterium]MDY0365212.1 site-specific DNA-methyltransferase [Arcobacteraceae bacterium]
MSNEQKVTNDIKVPNKDLEILKTHFSHCFDKDGKFDIVKFQSQLNTQNLELTTEKESYGLEWLGKSYARLLASDPATTLLKADENHNSKPENINSENLLIKGDNLEVLKHLANAYYEKVKMIYIDPPYNTGNDGFVYNDDRKFTVRELQNLIGIDEEKANRILDFTKSSSNSHSAWLTFMYPRLYIAKQLLKDDGVIFVSIDDNEVAQLRLLMDEVFGEENFVVNAIWEKVKIRKNSAKEFSDSHDHILIFCKNKSYWVRNLLPRKEISNYKNPDNDERGVWIPIPIHANHKYDANYKITKPNGVVLERPKNNYWRLSEENFQKHVEENRIWWGNDNSYPMIKRFLSEVQNGLVPKSIFYYDEVGGNPHGDSELKKLFEGNKLFENPKSVGLLKNIITIGSSETDIILDFFAGSGTTGHAVMQLNAEDGGNRKFILVQLPEPIDPKKNKVAYNFVKEEIKAEPTIFEITKERLLRAAKKINAELDEKIDKLKNELPTDETKAEIEKLENLKTQNNFKVYETAPIWEDYDFEAEEFDSSQTLFDTGKLLEDDIKALLTTWKTYDGIALTQDLESVDLNGYTAYYGNGRLYLMHKGFTTESLKALLEKIDTDNHFEPKSIIAFGYHFESARLREISENVKTYNNKKKSDIDFITRY